MRRRLPDAAEVLAALDAIIAYDGQQYHWRLGHEVAAFARAQIEESGLRPFIASNALAGDKLVQGLAWLNGNGDRGPPNFEEQALGLALELAVIRCEAERSRLSFEAAGQRAQQVRG